MATGAAVKFDADLDSVSHDADIKLGQSVGFTLLPDGGLACVLQDGVIVIGRVPATHIDNVKNGNCRGTIRSIQRSRDEDRRITGINVRWQSQDSGGQPGYNGTLPRLQRPFSKNASFIRLIKDGVMRKTILQKPFGIP